MQKSTGWLVGGLAALSLSLAGAVAWTWQGPAPVAAASAPAPAAGTVTVTMEGLAYRPAALSVPVGTTVIWVNRDAVPHNVVASNRSFASGLLDRDATWSRTFTEPGTFTYVCTLHPGMVARVTVTAGPTGLPAQEPPVAPPGLDAPPDQGAEGHCGGLSDEEMRKMMDSVHGQGSFDRMTKAMDDVMGPGWHDKMHQGGSRSRTSSGTGWGMGGMMGGFGGAMRGMMGW